MCDALQLNWKLNPNVSGGNNVTNVVGNQRANGSNGIVRQQGERRSGPAVKRGKKDPADKSYTLRACSIQKRMETEHRKTQPRKRGPKPRPKSAPMSKYRRKTANMRERQRMGEIKVAFEKLRDKERIVRGFA